MGRDFCVRFEIEENCYFLARAELLQSSLSHRKAVIANMAFGLSLQDPSKTLLFISSCLGTAAFKFKASNGFQPQKTSNFIFHYDFLLSLRCCLDDEPQKMCPTVKAFQSHRNVAKSKIEDTLQRGPDLFGHHNR